MFGCESCQDMRIYFGGQFCQRGHLHPLTNSKSEMMSHVGGCCCCCNTWAELDRPPWKPSIGSSGHRHQPRRLEQLKSPAARISRVLWSTPSSEVAENDFPPRKRRSSRETNKKWTSCHLAPVCVRVWQRGSHLKVTRIRLVNHNIPTEKVSFSSVEKTHLSGSGRRKPCGARYRWSGSFGSYKRLTVVHV